jgi:protein-tyrosine-phosphatase
MNLLFVCTGNTCRSPLAEVIGKAEARARGVENVSCASAGTFACIGQCAAAPGIDVAAAHGLDLVNHISQPLTPALLDCSDYLIGMDQSHIDGARQLKFDLPACLLTHFLPVDHTQYGYGVPDPYGGDFDVYSETFALLEVAVQRLFDGLSVEKELRVEGWFPSKLFFAADV